MIDALKPYAEYKESGVDREDSKSLGSAAAEVTYICSHNRRTTCNASVHRWWYSVSVGG
ncbi:hypothetical protein METP1_01666 [Methanosarcinales archaeon]|nr:hypothetical protein METP1_01666 [Methanosarcinales archaeon]